MIKINVDTRIWEIPEEEKILGVESDDKVKTLQFELSKNEFYNGLNFTDCNCFINYKNEYNDTIPYGITDMELQEDGTVTFTWEVSRGATISKGNTVAILCVKKVREDGTITNEWNSRVGTFRVHKGIEPSDSIVEKPEIDIVSQLLVVAQQANTNAQTNIDQSEKLIEQSNSLLEKAEGLGYLKEDFDVLEARMNQFTSLEEGSTTGDAELQDIRVGYNGEVYPNAGDAVRGQVSQLSSEIEEIGAYRVNEFNKNDITIGKYPNSSIGQSINTFVEKENSFVCNQRWRVKRGDVLRWSWSYANFYIYDENGILIEKMGSDGLKEGTIQSENAHTLVYLNTSSISENYIDNFMFTINRELPTEYVEYGLIGIDTYNVKKINERIDEIVNTDHIPYVVLNFDNQIASIDDNVVTLLEKYGFKGSFVGWQNPTVIMELLNRGWDIGTYDNSPDILPPSSTIDSTDEGDIAQYDNYVQKAQKKQSDIGVFNPTVWCSRQNKWGSALEKGVKKYGYKMARAYQTGDVYNLNYDKNFPILDSQRFYTADLSTVNSVINNSINKPNSIIIILAHKLIDNEEEDRGYDCLASTYETMLINLKSKVDSEMIKVVTYRELYKELYPNNGYENDYNRLLKMSQFDYNV